MAINKVKINNLLIFKGEFSMEFCRGVNVLIGGNSTGKTTLLKTLYWWVDNHSYLDWESNPRHREFFTGIEHYFGGSFTDGDAFDGFDIKVHPETHEKKGVYIPEKDILEHSPGLLTFIEQKKRTGFSQVYKNLLIAAQDIPTQKQSKTQQSVGAHIAEIVGGDVRRDKEDGSFYILKTDGRRIPFSHEASGYKRLGFLGLLVVCGQLEKGSILFWDEPENSLNPELIPELVDILLELAKNDMQIFIATHDYNIARYFDVRKDKSIPVLFHNFTKIEENITCYSSPEYIKLPNNLLEAASEDLFKAVVSDALEVTGDE